MDEIESNESFRVWIINHLAKKLAGHAILKGGMILRILDCPRYTNDIDYVFVPFQSKNEIVPLMKKAFHNVEGVEFSYRLHSTHARFLVKVSNSHGSFQTQIEIDVAPACEYEPISTGNFATQYHQQPEVISVMRFDVAMAHKLAAWNERNLYRDLYDAYFLHVNLRTKPNLQVLTKRLQKIKYAKRIGDKNRPRQMTLGGFADKLRQAADQIRQQEIKEELRDVLLSNHLAGLDKKIKIAMNQISEDIQFYFDNSSATLEGRK